MQKQVWSSGRVIHVVLIEDHALFRTALREEIDAQADMRCIGSFGSAPAALDALSKGLAPDTVILDLGLPKMHGLEALPELRRLLPRTKLMVLTITEDRSNVMEALALGADGYLLKTAPMDRILAGIRNIMQGEVPMSPAIANLVLATLRKSKPKAEADGLTSREIEVLHALAEGCSRKLVAEKFDLSLHTVDNHMRKIYEKLHVHNVAGALKRASDRGLI